MCSCEHSSPECILSGKNFPATESFENLNDAHSVLILPTDSNVVVLWKHPQTHPEKCLTNSLNTSPVKLTFTTLTQSYLISLWLFPYL